MSKIHKVLAVLAIGVIFIVSLIALNKKTNTRKIIGNKMINHPNVMEIKDLEIIKSKIKNKEKFAFYIGHSLCGDCGDFYNGPFQDILKNNPDLKFYYADWFARKDIKGNWEKTIGPKNNFDANESIPSPLIKNFTFYFTPTIVFVENGEAKYVFSDYGGGEKRVTRYFRNGSEEEKIIGRQNALNDVQEIINKWK